MTLGFIHIEDGTVAAIDRSAKKVAVFLDEHVSKVRDDQDAGFEHACCCNWGHFGTVSIQEFTKLRLFVAIDRTSKFPFVELHQEGGKMIAAQFPRNLVAAVPYVIHTVLTDNGIQFTNHAHHKNAFHHLFDRVCDENGIEHRLTKVKHLDQRPGGTHEPHDQGSDGQALSLRQQKTCFEQQH